MSQVARRYDVNANLVFTWLRDPQFAGEGFEGETPRFLPVEIVEGRSTASSATAPESRIEIDAAGGHRVRVFGEFDPDALARLIHSLSS